MEKFIVENTSRELLRKTRVLARVTSSIAVVWFVSAKSVTKRKTDMANAELCVSNLMQFLPDFRELLDIGEIAFSLLAKSVIRLDQYTETATGTGKKYI